MYSIFDDRNTGRKMAANSKSEYKFVTHPVLCVDMLCCAALSLLFAPSRRDTSPLRQRQGRRRREREAGDGECIYRVNIRGVPSWPFCEHGPSRAGSLPSRAERGFFEILLIRAEPSQNEPNFKRAEPGQAEPGKQALFFAQKALLGKKKRDNFVKKNF